MRRRFDKGSVVGFIVVGVLLTAALVGGIWLARHPLNSSKEADDTSNTTDTARDVTSSGESHDTATTDEQLKQTLTEQATSSSATQHQAAASTGTSGALPTTGPADVMIEMVGATLLTGVTVAYVRSRAVS